MPLPSSPAEPQTALARLRAHYQKGLLAWLQHPERGAGLTAMRAALQDAARIAPQPCWTTAEALLAALERGALPPRLEYRRLAGRVDQALRRAARQEQGDDPDLLDALATALAQLDPPAPAPLRPLVPRPPLASTLAATAAVLPLLAQARAPRFQAEQRRAWDAAVADLGAAWEARAAGWQPLRQAVFRLLEGSLALAHPAPLRLAEALASATDALEAVPPGPRLLAALHATLELLQSPDFLEHDALEARVAQLVPRLEAGDREGSPALEALFRQEAEEILEHLHLALEAVPPDDAALIAGARQLEELAEHAERSDCQRWAAALGTALSRLGPAELDHGPARQALEACLAHLADWLRHADSEGRDAASAELDAALARLARY